MMTVRVLFVGSVGIFPLTFALRVLAQCLLGWPAVTYCTEATGQTLRTQSLLLVWSQEDPIHHGI